MDPGPDELVWEVGPGLGCLTEPLLSRVGSLFAFEIDRGIIRYLDRYFAHEEKLKLVAGDILKTWRQVRETRGIPDKVVGNLPFPTASALIAAFVEQEFYPPRMIFTIQKELADRMTALPRSKAYASFSVICQIAYRIRECFELRPGSFYPAPGVLTTVIELTPAGNPELPPGKVISRLVRELFRSRRKTLQNNLFFSFQDWDRDFLLELLRQEKIDPAQRAEELPPEAFLRLASRLASCSEVGRRDSLPN